MTKLTLKPIQICGNCAFFQPATSECRRFPPQLTLVMASVPSTVTHWPTTDAGDWCGEHREAARR